MDIENQLAEIDKKILEAIERVDLVQRRQYELKKELLEISEACRQGKSNLSALRVSKDSLTREYWSYKNK